MLDEVKVIQKFGGVVRADKPPTNLMHGDMLLQKKYSALVRVGNFEGHDQRYERSKVCLGP